MLVLALRSHFPSRNEQPLKSKTCQGVVCNAPLVRTIYQSLHWQAYQILRDILTKPSYRSRRDQLFPPVKCWYQQGEWQICVFHSPHNPKLQVIVPPLTWHLDMAWNRRAVYHTKVHIALVTANAFVSTLGGGHFLCKHLAQAKRLARIQQAIAICLGDQGLAWRCRVHLAYSAMHQGHFKRARRILVKIPVQTDEELKAIVHAAEVYLAKTVEIHRQVNLKGQKSLVDNFYRQRIPTS